MKKIRKIVIPAVFLGIVYMTLSPITVWAGESWKRVEKGGAQLWSENCARCHNLRPPSGHSDREWDMLVHSMRVKAGLTGEEARKILEFLKSAN